MSPSDGMCSAAGSAVVWPVRLSHRRTLRGQQHVGIDECLANLRTAVRTLLKESDADAVQLAQRFVVERHALGDQVLR